MAIRVLAVAETAENSAGIQAASSAVGEALTGADGQLLRVWKAPDSSAASYFLIVQDPPDVSSIAALIADAGLTLDSVVPVVSVETSDDADAAEQRIIAALPETTPDTLLSPAPIAFSGVETIDYGLAMCPTCGGWGGHLFQHP
jgi:hypothetical protein